MCVAFRVCSYIIDFNQDNTYGCITTARYYRCCKLRWFPDYEETVWSELVTRVGHLALVCCCSARVLAALCD